MEDVFDTFNHITRREERNKVYSELNFELVSQMSREQVHEVSVGKYTRQTSISAAYKGHKLALISNMVTSNTLSNPVGIRVVTSLTEA